MPEFVNYEKIHIMLLNIKNNKKNCDEFEKDVKFFFQLDCKAKYLKFILSIDIKIGLLE